MTNTKEDILEQANNIVMIKSYLAIMQAMINPDVLQGLIKEEQERLSFEVSASAVFAHSNSIEAMDKAHNTRRNNIRFCKLLLKIKDFDLAASLGVAEVKTPGQ